MYNFQQIYPINYFHNLDNFALINKFSLSPNELGIN